MRGACRGGTSRDGGCESSARLAALFLVAVSVALSVSVTSWIMLGSLRATVEAKTKVFVGSDVQLHVGPDTEVPQGFPLPATVASRVREAGYLSDGRQFDLLAVDPHHFRIRRVLERLVLGALAAGSAGPPRRAGEPSATGDRLERWGPGAGVAGDGAATDPHRCGRRHVQLPGVLV